MSFFVFLYGFYFKVYFVWYEYCNSCFPVLCIGMKSLPSPLTFNLYVSFALRWVSFRQQIEVFCFFIQSPTLCLLVEAFSPLTFKVIIDRYVFIAILNLVFQLILCFSFLLFFFGLDGFHLFYAWVLFSFCKCNVWFDFMVALFFKHVKPFLLAFAW